MPESIGESLGITKNQVDLVYGGPPCQAFSQAGKQRGVDDPRGQLIGEFLRYIESIQPRYFVMENVQGLAGVSNGKLLQNILQEMNHLGFNVNWGLLNAADYGAPQLRKRLIFIGTRNEYESAHLPSATHSAGLSLLANHVYKTVGEAFVGLPICESEETIQTQLALT